MIRPLPCSLWLAMILLTAASAALAGAGPALPPAGIGVHDQASLQRGARLFFAYCVGCHSLKFMRYSRLSQDLGLTEKDVMDNLDVTGATFGEPVVSRMPEDSARQWFGKAPPDLSLEARARGPGWIYAYLNAFYLDPTRPVGWNNAVFPNASMPNPLWELQGLQTRGKHPGADTVGELELSRPGALAPARFQQATRDLAGFLAYVSEPAALQRKRYGIWVLLFLAIFTCLAYLLKREYWKDVD